MPESSNPIVAIYVRLGGLGHDQDETVRDITFDIPAGLDPLDLLDTGFAIDGREATYTIAYDRDAGYFDAPFNASAPSLSGALAATQRALVAYLRERGFEPKFA